MKKLILIGGGGHCKSCIDVIEQENKYKIVGILDLKDKIGNTVLGYPIIGTDDDIENYIKQDCYFIITVGQIRTADKRKQLFEKLEKLNAKIATIISPLSYISKHAQIGFGTIIMHNVIVNADVKIGNNCIINTNALIEHETTIGNNCHISTSSVINGGVSVGNDVFIGSNSTIIQGTNISDSAFIKANSLVK